MCNRMKNPATGATDIWIFLQKMQRVFCNLCTICAHNLAKSTIFIIALTIIYIFLQCVLLSVKKSGEKNCCNML